MENARLLEINPNLNDDIEELLSLVDDPEETFVNYVNTAISLLSWAMQERRRGRIIGSVDEIGGNYKEVSFPLFEKVKLE
jgi:hypothetical protein